MNTPYFSRYPGWNPDPALDTSVTADTLTPIEQDMRSAGFVRCPNVASRWYAGSAGMKEPVFPLELRVTDAIWLVTRPYGQEPKPIIPLMRFDSAASLNSYLERNHKLAEAAAPFSNSWD